jgi:hypothetical protein
VSWYAEPAEALTFFHVLFRKFVFIFTDVGEWYDFFQNSVVYNTLCRVLHCGLFF